MNRLIKIFSFLLLLGACATDVTPSVNLSYVNRIDLPEMPRPLTLLEVEWTINNLETLIDILQKLNVINDTEAKNFKDRLVNNPNNQIFSQFVLDGKNFENLMLNQSEIKRFLEQQRAVIEYFIQATEHTRNRDTMRNNLSLDVK